MVRYTVRQTLHWEHKISRGTTCSLTCFEEHGALLTEKPNFSSPGLKNLQKLLNHYFNKDTKFGSHNVVKVVRGNFVGLYAIATETRDTT